MGGGAAADRHADRPVAGLLQFLHQSDPVRVLQQEVPQGLHGHHQVGPVLRQAALLRDRGDHVVVHVDAQVLVLREQQLVAEARFSRAAGAPGQQRVVHLQSQVGARLGRVAAVNHVAEIPSAPPPSPAAATCASSTAAEAAQRLPRALTGLRYNRDRYMV
ncbi:unnamed protein product [Trichogramma brassicae]|uniref:Uncharacterized protein n=1 Tax=Trichogramma brassicae TaxID=86971 RepID=A0A6H5IP78_9HYME|nr:unnamed protein product [Trichogramma brassicae]